MTFDELWNSFDGWENSEIISKDGARQIYNSAIEQTAKESEFDNRNYNILWNLYCDAVKVVEAARKVVNHVQDRCL